MDFFSGAVYNGVWARQNFVCGSKILHYTTRTGAGASPGKTPIDENKLVWWAWAWSRQ